MIKQEKNKERNSIKDLFQEFECDLHGGNALFCIASHYQKGRLIVGKLLRKLEEGSPISDVVEALNDWYNSNKKRKQSKE